jgi:hypothetical protein
MGWIMFKHYYCKTNSDYSYSRGFYYTDKPTIADNAWFKKEENFYKCEIEKPPFEINEKVYIPELDLTVLITDRIRSIDGSVVFKTNYEIKIIEDECTIESLAEATKNIEQETGKYNDWISSQKSSYKKSGINFGCKVKEYIKTVF